MASIKTVITIPNDEVDFRKIAEMEEHYGEEVDDIVTRSIRQLIEEMEAEKEADGEWEKPDNWP